MPALPGATTISSAGSSRSSFHASACSRPPPPTSRSFTLCDRHPSCRPPPNVSRRAPHRVGRLLRDAADLRAVIARGVGVVVAQRPLRVRRASARIVAADHAIVLARFDPPLQLRGAHGVERVSAVHHVQQLEHTVQRAAARLVLARLHEELVETRLVVAALAAGEAAGTCASRRAAPATREARRDPPRIRPCDTTRAARAERAAR